MLNKRFGSIKGAVSDLHRDVTTRRCLTSYDRVEDIVRECVTIKNDLDRADDMMDDHKMEFEKRWQQEQLRIKTEQAMFNEQVRLGANNRSSIVGFHVKFLSSFLVALEGYNGSRLNSFPVETSNLTFIQLERS